MAILIIGFSTSSVSGQQGSWVGVGACPGLAAVTPHPPAICYPLVPTSKVPPKSIGCAPMPPAWQPILVGPQLDRPEPSLQVGYLYGDRGSEFRLNYGRANEQGVLSTKNDGELQGVWAELAIPIVLTQRADFVFTAGRLFPVQTDFPQYYSVAGGAAAKRDWRSDVRWWELNTAWMYRFSRLMSGILGFRWFSMDIEFHLPTNQQGFSNTNDEAKFIANAYIPFLGVLLKSNSNDFGCLKAAVIGFPGLPGDFQHTETMNLNGQPVSSRFFPGGTYRSGYFVEALGDYTVHKRDWNFGAFVRFTAMHSERDRDLNVNGISSQTDLSFDRRSWIFGGKIGFTL